MQIAKSLSFLKNVHRQKKYFIFSILKISVLRFCII